MSLKSSGYGGFEGKYQREGESSRFVPWVFFFLVVGGSGCGCGRGLSVMSLKSSGHGGFESKYQMEGEASSG